MATLAARLLAFVQAVGADIKALTTNMPSTGGTATQFWRGDKVWATPAAGGADPWTRLKLAADFTNATVNFADITGLAYTPPANSDFIVEAELLIWTTAIANLPRVGVSVPAGFQYFAVEIRQAGATDITQAQQHGGGTSAATLVQMPAGGLAVASVPRMCTVVIKGRSGAAPAALKLQMAAETAGANICFVKAGSEMRSRVIA